MKDLSRISAQEDFIRQLKIFLQDRDEFIRREMRSGKKALQFIIALLELCRRHPDLLERIEAEEVELWVDRDCSLSIIPSELSLELDRDKAGNDELKP